MSQFAHAVKDATASLKVLPRRVVAQNTSKLLLDLFSSTGNVFYLFPRLQRGYYHVRRIIESRQSFGQMLLNDATDATDATNILAQHVE